MSKRGYKRRKLLIDKAQYKLLVVYLIHFVAVLVIVFSALVFIFTRQLEHSSLTAIQRQEVAGRILWFYGHLWPFMWGIFMLLVVHSIYVTHKIAGPLYRIKSVLWSVKNGDLTSRVKTRTGDYLTDHAQAVNDVIDTYRNKMEGLQVMSSSVDSARDNLSSAIDQGSLDEARQRFDELSDQIDGLHKSLGFFKVSTRSTGADSQIPRDATVEDLTPVA